MTRRVTIATMASTDNIIQAMCLAVRSNYRSEAEDSCHGSRRNDLYMRRKDLVYVGEVGCSEILGITNVVKKGIVVQGDSGNGEWEGCSLRGTMTAQEKLRLRMQEDFGTDGASTNTVR